MCWEGLWLRNWGPIPVHNHPSVRPKEPSSLTHFIFHTRKTRAHYKFLTPATLGSQGTRQFWSDMVGRTVPEHSAPTPLTGQRGPWCLQQAAGQGPAAGPEKDPPLRGQAMFGSEGVPLLHPAEPTGSANSESWGL